MSVQESDVRLINEIQQEIQRTNMARSKLHVQLSENEIVLVELNHVRVTETHGSVYKLVGPMLVKQDLDEAKANVQKRIEFIRGELKRLDAKAAEDQAKIAAQNKRLMDLQREQVERSQRQQMAAQQQAIAAATAATTGAKPQ